jgi:dihydrofolate synthase/folylpolyglutamate synthase
MSDEPATQRYEAAVERLQERGRFGIRLGLERTHALLRELGNPEQGLSGVLIGGTNGKGSVQAMVGAVLREQGLLVGQMPKPHLSQYRERIVVGGQPLGESEFADTVEVALAAASAIEPDHGPPTEFEVLTAAAFHAFAAAGIDVLVAEVGMGGRLDATNAWQGGVSAITNVALDHMEHLGPTVQAIAHEKAAIIKPGDVRAVTGADGDALPVIRRRAGRVSVPLDVVQPLEVVAMDRAGLTLRAPGLDDLQVGLLGRHQAANAAVALAVLDALAQTGLRSPDDAAVRRGMAGVRWPGRLELLTLPDGTDVLLDGAHNPHGAAALATALDELRPDLSPGRPVLLLGMLADKDVTALIGALRGARLLDEAHVVATTVPDAPRALPAPQLADAWGHGAEAVADATHALERAREHAQSAGGPLIVCGSLYLVGHVRTIILATA